MTLRPSATFHLHSETATTGEESPPWFATEASIISALSTIPRLTAFATSPSMVMLESGQPPNKRLKLAGGDRSKGTGVLSPGVRQLTLNLMTACRRVARSL